MRFFVRSVKHGPRGAAFSAVLALQAGSRAGDRRGKRLPYAGDVASTLFRGGLSQVHARRGVPSGLALNDLDGLGAFPRKYAVGDGAA